MEARRDPGTEEEAIGRIAAELGVHPEALRVWVRQAEVDDGLRPGTTSEDTERITHLEKKVRELKRANEILRTASAYFAQAKPGRR